MSTRRMWSNSEVKFLEEQRVARIATLDPKGVFPHVVPICYVFDRARFYTTLSKDAKRSKNIRSDNKVSLLVDEYEERSGEWITLRGILVKCRALSVSYSEDPHLFMKGWRLLLRKYPQYAHWAYEDLRPKDPDKRMIMQIQPIEKTAWGFSS